MYEGVRRKEGEGAAFVGPDVANEEVDSGDTITSVWNSERTRKNLKLYFSFFGLIFSCLMDGGTKNNQKSKMNLKKWRRFFCDMSISIFFTKTI